MAGESGCLPRFLSREAKRLPGVRRVVRVPNPAAGVDWSVPVPAGAMWRILTGTATFTASANVANRHPGITFNTGDGIIFRSADSNAIVAGIVSNYSFVVDGINAQQAATGLWSELALPDLWLPSQTTVAGNTTAIDVADQWSNVALFVEELYATDQVLSEWEERELEAYSA